MSTLRFTILGCGSSGGVPRIGGYWGDCDPANPAGFIINEMVGLSPKAYNATLYYENDLFSARVSAAYRDAYLQQVPGRNNNALEGKQDTLTIDAAATWNERRANSTFFLRSKYSAEMDSTNMAPVV